MIVDKTHNFHASVHNPDKPGYNPDAPVYNPDTSPNNLDAPVYKLHGSVDELSGLHDPCGNEVAVFCFGWNSQDGLLALASRPLWPALGCLPSLVGPDRHLIIVLHICAQCQLIIISCPSGLEPGGFSCSQNHRARLLYSSFQTPTHAVLTLHQRHTRRGLPNHYMSGPAAPVPRTLRCG